MSDETVVGDKRDELTELKARIRELELQLKDEKAMHLFAEKKFTDRIAKAKAILEETIGPWYKHSIARKAALAALEEK